MDKAEYIELCDLARIEIESDKIDENVESINKVEHFIKMLDKLDLEGVEPAIRLDESFMTLREDDTIEGLDKKEIMQNAPEENYGYFALRNMME